MVNYTIAHGTTQLVFLRVHSLTINENVDILYLDIRRTDISDLFQQLFKLVDVTELTLLNLRFVLDEHNLTPISVCILGFCSYFSVLYTYIKDILEFNTKARFAMTEHLTKTSPKL